MKFIELTSYSHDENITVNTDRILYIRPDNRDNTTQIIFEGGEKFYVKEEYSIVKKKLGRS